jgi:hypothetical protein
MRTPEGGGTGTGPRKTFVVGRSTTRGTELVVAESLHTPAPIPGPWTLRALVRPSGVRLDAGSPHPIVH